MGLELNNNYNIIKNEKELILLLKDAMSSILNTTFQMNHHEKQNPNMISIMKIINQYDIVSYYSLAENPISISILHKVSLS